MSPLRYSNYDEQQYDELRTLLEVINTKDTPILLGDLNSSPASAGISWILPFHHGLINARGLVSPYVLDDGRCTFCASENPAVAMFTQMDTIVDHIFIETSDFRGRVVSSEVCILILHLGHTRHLHRISFQILWIIIHM